jgi:hypothetical protein
VSAERGASLSRLRKNGRQINAINEMLGLWCTTSDINSNWKSVANHGFNQNGLEKWAALDIGTIPICSEIGNGDLTPDENYTHMNLWCMLAVPLLIGCDMQKMSPFIISLFTNDEVLDVDQDSRGKQGWRAKRDGDQEVWEKPFFDGLAVVFSTEMAQRAMFRLIGKTLNYPAPKPFVISGAREISVFKILGIAQWWLRTGRSYSSSSQRRDCVDGALKA